MENIISLSEANTAKARATAQKLGLISLWEKQGGQANFVGSLANGLYMNSHDLDVHAYTEPFSLETSFSVMTELAKTPGLQTISYNNLLHTEEACLEWHATYVDEENQKWLLDIIHIVKGSKYDGHFEKQAALIKSQLTDETRKTVLEIKNAHNGPHIGGIWVYQAVLKEGIRTPEEFQKWYAKQDPMRIVEWA